MFTLDRIPDVFKPLEINETLQSIPSGEAFDEAGAMLEHTADEVIRHTYIKDAVRTICKDVNVSTCHGEILQDVDGRDI
jgi:hypothetical protein